MHCYFCNGYYGSCYGEPVCAVCHSFIFPDMLGYHINLFLQTQQEIDDGDSGNDEPTDPYYNVETREQRVLEATSPSIPPQSSVEEHLERLCTPNSSNDYQLSGSAVVFTCLPPEVMLAVFSFLDELSLWSVGNVCRQWRKLLQLIVTPSTWYKYTTRRWPLFHPISEVDDWFEVYSSLIRSSACLSCIRQMALQKMPQEEENSWRRNRLRSELKLLRTDPLEGIQAVPLDAMCCHWQATISGPCGSPYEGGLFFLYIQVPYTYPMCPPVVRFLTKVFHPNISRHGDVGIDSINHNWSLALTIPKVLISVQSLLTDPFCEISMEPNIANLYLTDRETFENRARLWTRKYAMNDFHLTLRDNSTCLDP